MDRSEYENLKQRAEEDYRQNLAAIERVWTIAQANGIAVGAGTGSISAEKRITVQRKRRRGGKQSRIINDVRSAVKNIPGIFNFSHVIQRLAEEKPDLQIKRGTLKAALKRLSETGEIEIVSQGIGRRPTQFRRK